MLDKILMKFSFKNLKILIAVLMILTVPFLLAGCENINLTTVGEVTEDDEEIDDEEPEDFTVGGTIVTTEGDPLAGVEVDIECDELDITTTTDLEGQYESSGHYGEAEITPQKDDFDFSPGSIRASNDRENADFEASPHYYTTEGRLEDENDNGIPGLTLEFTSVSNPAREIESVTTDSDGYWEKTGLVGDVVVTPRGDLEDISGEAWSFAPFSKTISYDPDGVDDIKFEGTKKDVAEVYEISGEVYDPDGIERNVILAIENSDGSTNYAVTDDDGEWTKEALTGTVYIRPIDIPGHDGDYEFSPTERRATTGREDVDFTVYEID